METIASPIKKAYGMWSHALAILLLALASTGCALVPPQKIPVDRRNYIEAVSTSWKEQLLSNMIKLRYGDTLTFLEMTSITTSYSLDANLTAGYTTPWRPLAGTTGFRNQFVGGGSVTYSDKPTISYAPLRGEALAKVLIKPIPAEQLLRSYQTGFRADYVFSCCVKSLNDHINPWDPKFFEIANLFYEFIKAGVLRIVVSEEKAPTKYDVTLHTKDIIFKEKKKAGSDTAAAGKVGHKSQKLKNNGQMAGNDNDKEDNEEPSIALLVLDRKRAGIIDAQWRKKAHKPEEKPPVQNFKNLLWPDYDARIKEGADLYERKCEECHGKPNGSPREPKIANFNDPHFWVGEMDLKIPHAVTRGKGDMKKIEEMKPGQIKAVITFIKQVFGKYEVYRIINGNESPPQKDPYCDKIVMRTRSIMQVFLYLSQFIDVPDEHLPHRENRAEKRSSPDQPLDGPGGDLEFTIKNQKERPSDAFVAVRHSGYWFYIDDKNVKSKNVFSGIAGILSLSEPGTKEGTPVLTLPVQ